MSHETFWMAVSVVLCSFDLKDRSCQQQGLNQCNNKDEKKCDGEDDTGVYNIPLNGTGKTAEKLTMLSHPGQQPQKQDSNHRWALNRGHLTLPSHRSSAKQLEERAARVNFREVTEGILDGRKIMIVEAQLQHYERP